MSDQVDCDLTVWGVATQAQVDLFCEILEKRHEVEKSVSRRLFEPGFDNVLYLEDVESGAMHLDLEAALSEAGIGYCWAWKPGGNFGAGLTVFDPVAKEYYEFHTVNDQLCLTIGQLNGETIAEIHAAQSLLSKTARMPFRVASSAHECIQVIENTPELKPYIDIRAA